MTCMSAKHPIESIMYGWPIVSLLVCPCTLLSAHCVPVFYENNLKSTATDAFGSLRNKLTAQKESYKRVPSPGMVMVFCWYQVADLMLCCTYPASMLLLCSWYAASGLLVCCWCATDVMLFATNMILMVCCSCLASVLFCKTLKQLSLRKLCLLGLLVHVYNLRASETHDWLTTHNQNVF